MKEILMLFLLSLCFKHVVGQQLDAAGVNHISKQNNNKQKRKKYDENNSAEWVKLGADNKLIYKKDEKGNKIMDFSGAGYMGGGVPLPDVPVKITLLPRSGEDQTTTIQNAINEVALMPLVNGFRGAVLLMPGTFDISNTINLNVSGVVLRGSGSGNGGTVINWKGGVKKVCFNMSGNGNYVVTNSVDIIDSYVPSGADFFNVSDASSYSKGDKVLIYRTVTKEWISFMKMDLLVRNDKPQIWIKEGNRIITDRTIESVSGNMVALDVPLTDCFDSQYLGIPVGTMVKYTFQGRIEQVGIEHLKIIAPASATDIYGAINMDNIIDSWIRNIVSLETHNAFVVKNKAKRITLDSIVNNNSIPQTVPAHPATFSLTGTQILLSNSESNGKGAWAVVTQSVGTGPIVILNFKSTQNYGIAPHSRWTTGVLADNCYLPEAIEGLSFRNRHIAGSGHGWTTGWSVAWNVITPKFLSSQAPGTTNWIIGGVGTKTSRIRYGDEDGIYDYFNTNVVPQSLYLQQLKERLVKEK